ncbi:hypothetical protein F4777DRAFT_533162 [Nemania sp. FL0916]|nr:hypothetical protein F4777DRAFT_533162 [Nemania sp. FL0916]
MPPRIPGVQRLTTFSPCLRPAVPSHPPTLLPITQTASLSQREKKKIAKRDPYRWEQMQQRKAAHKSRHSVIEAERRAAQGDPVRGLTTPFVESFDSGGQAALSTPPVDADGKPLEEAHPLPTSPHILNNQVARPELENALSDMYKLTRPMDSVLTDSNPEERDERRELHEATHARAAEAVQRILDLQNSSSKDRRHANIRRCVETFGRHNTDLTLPPKPLSRGQPKEEKPVRGGPDTGSSEVQIAILTAKIRTLADELEKGRGYKDKFGKRGLRLMVHKRQKLLAYMERKERGNARWQHMMEKLGLTEANYKGQITM